MKVLFLRLRIEDDLHDAVLKEAIAESRSMNNMGNILLEEALRARHPFAVVPDKEDGHHARAAIKELLDEPTYTDPEAAA